MYSDKNLIACISLLYVSAFFCHSQGASGNYINFCVLLIYAVLRLYTFHCVPLNVATPCDINKPNQPLCIKLKFISYKFRLAGIRAIVIYLQLFEAP